jgi:pyruvate formate lyase activating enzyme
MATFPILETSAIHPPVQRTRGWIHSWETSAGQDGPGWRLIVYLSGCPLRCLYCHNPDTWKLGSGREMSTDSLWSEIRRYRPLLRKGGITFTGGEPLLQASFLHSLLRRAKDEGVHTAVDTSGFLGDRVDDAMMRDIDLVLLDIKSWNRGSYLRLTGQELDPTLRFARRLAVAARPVWLRYVLVPGLTDVPEEIDGLAAFAASLGNIERVDVLPFHQLGMTKWNDLGLDYKLRELHPPAPESVAAAVRIFAKHGLRAC